MSCCSSGFLVLAMAPDNAAARDKLRARPIELAMFAPLPPLTIRPQGHWKQSRASCIMGRGTDGGVTGGPKLNALPVCCPRGPDLRLLHFRSSKSFHHRRQGQPADDRRGGRRRALSLAGVDRDSVI